LVQQEIWGIRINQELRELYKNPDILADKYKEEMGMEWKCSTNGSGKES
jgi:hypothetical protein